jgi:hypothetical protein
MPDIRMSLQTKGSGFSNSSRVGDRFWFHEERCKRIDRTRYRVGGTWSVTGWRGWKLELLPDRESGLYGERLRAKQHPAGSCEQADRMLPGGGYSAGTAGVCRAARAW